MHGSPGTGKTLLAKAVANETNANFFLINGPEIMSKYYGQSEENLRKKFEEAEKNAPSIIFIDEIDAIASKREESKGEVERRVVAQLLALMDGLKSRGKLVVMAATNIPNQLDPALRRPGRFDREIEIGVPSKEGRLNILKIHTRNMPLRPNIDITLLRNEINLSINRINVQIDRLKEQSKDAKEKVIENPDIKELENKKNEYIEKLNNLKHIKSNKEFKAYLESKEISKELESTLRDLLEQAMLSEVADITHGFVGADLAALSREAAMSLLRRRLPELKLLKEEDPIPQEILEKLVITQKDLIDALRVVRPSALREVLIEVPNVKWDSIGGLEDVKQELIEAVEWPLKHANVFKRLGIEPPKGVLLYGPPGTGKTMLAKAVANESSANFIVVKGPELLSKWVGESEKGVRKIFEKARQASPTIIFFDEIDAIAPRRGMSQDNNVAERVVNQMLTEIDGLEEMHNIVVIGATNRPDILDTALLRPGRFDRIVLAGVPDEKARKSIFKVHLSKIPLSNDVDINDLSDKTNGYVGADIEAVCREAAMLALRKDMKASEVNKLDFEQALKKVRPSVSRDVEDLYKQMKDQFSAAKSKEMLEDKPSYYG